MSSVGVFLEKEINGKPFHIFTSNELCLEEPRFLCPTLRLEVEELKRKEEGYSSDNKDAYPVDTSSQHLLDYVSRDDICKHSILPLFWCNNQRFHFPGCGACHESTIGTDYYMCVTCDTNFHRECVESPSFIKHPSYPFLSFQRYTVPYDTHEFWRCIICETRTYTMAYYSHTYKLAMHLICALKPIPILIDNLKRHPHPLIFFPKQNSLACNVCGIIKNHLPTYVCARCVFVVHQDCIDFPYVIRISRHQHRISFTYSLPSENLFCGVCRKKLDNDYGAYSCNQCDHDHGYFVHSRCALQRDLWNGEELEEVAEESEIVVEPYETIADGIILHFSHTHHLKLGTNLVYDDNKFCQGCVLPIYQGSYYSCVDHCDFILHEKCANMPLKKYHPLHAHSLTLQLVTDEYNYLFLGCARRTGHFQCSCCQRQSTGFVYESMSIEGGNDFRLDIRCASISEPFEYEGHEHPLFLALTPEEERSKVCQICNGEIKFTGTRLLNCIECDYIICFKCATLPYKINYKHDKHFLTFRKVKEGSDEYDMPMRVYYRSKKGTVAAEKEASED